MRQPSLLLALVLVCSLPLLARQEEGVARVTFRIYPPDTQVYWRPRASGGELSYIGKANLELAVTGRLLEQVGAGGVELVFRHPGFKDKSEIVQAGAFRAGESSSYPPDQVLQLEATSPWSGLYYWVRYHPLAASGWAAAAAAMAFILLRLQRDRSAKAARLRRLDELQARADQSDPLAMTVLGRYRLVERLGSGGMASVYRGLPEDTLDANQAVAVKVMQKDLAQEEEFRRRFHREIKVVKGLHHPNIVSLIDWGEQDGLLYLVMELVRGQPLTSRIPETGLPLGQAMQYLRPLFAALLYAHSQNVIHRDLKPDNVMVDEQGRVKVMDFGLAKSHDVSRITRTGSAMGTPAYMPPEQFTGGSPDQRSDQYSLGVVIYEMLTGRRPFEEEDTMVMLFKHMSEPPPPLRSLRPDLPEAVEPVVLRMLNKDPEERYPDLAAALQALEEASQGASSAGTAPGAPTREGGEATFIG